MPELLRGALPLAGYCALLRNLAALYDPLEAGFARHAEHPCLAPLYLEGLARSDALAADLLALHGPRWREELPLAPTALGYAQRLRELADACPERLAAHAYVRYLGDLSGGQVLGAIVARCYGLGAQADGTAFYRYAQDAGWLARRFREGLDATGHAAAAPDGIVEEARQAFQWHVRMFEELARPERRSPH